jgi:hypothetical protein
MSLARSTSLLPAVAGGILLAMAPAAAARDCDGDYYKALDALRGERATALGGLHRQLRTPDPALTGKWLFAAPLFEKSKKSTKPKVERVCVETKQASGRARCVRYEQRPVPPQPGDLATKELPSPDEMKLLRALNDFVEAKGAVPEIGPNGRHAFVVQRVAQDVRNYLTQPAHPAMCAGGAELTEFYLARLNPLKLRRDEVAVIAEKLLTAARARVRLVSTTEHAAFAKAEEQRRASEAAVVAAAAVNSEAAGTANPSHPATAALPPLGPKPPGTAPLETYAAMPLARLLLETARPLVAPADLTAIASEPSPYAALARAHAVVRSPGVAAPPVAPEVRDAALHAFRLIEARIYADDLFERLKTLERTLIETVAEIRAIRARTCTCD